MADAIVIDRDHPWPWLSAYTSLAAGYFNGRENDITQLMRCVLAAPVTVLFGRSGLGKTSLLRAGLTPALHDRRMLPVLVRPDYESASSVSTQILTELHASAALQGLHWSGTAPACGEPSGAVEALWERLHDTQRTLQGSDGQRWVPIVVLDPFEEVFTRVDSAQRRRQYFIELGDLIEGRIPAGVQARIHDHDELLDRVNPAQQGYRMLLSLREDFLPEFEAWADEIPRLGPNRYRLLPMSREQALRAVDVTGGDLVDSDGAQAIVAFLLKQAERGPRRRGEGERVEPALLSLVCASLNQQRLDLVPPGPKLDVSNLESRGGRILDGFYDQAFAGLTPEARAAAQNWVQQELITADGTRRSYPHSALHARGIAEATLRHLVDQRLLRIETGEQGDNIELVHDRLAGVAAERERDERRRAADVAKSEQEAREREQEWKRRRERIRLFAGAWIITLAISVASLIVVTNAYRKADATSEKLAYTVEDLNTTLGRLKSEQEHAVAAERKASDAAQTALRLAGKYEVAASQAAAAASRAQTAEGDARRESDRARQLALLASTLRLLAEGSEMAAGLREGGTVRGLLTVLAGDRLAADQSPYVRAAAQAALLRMTLANERLEWVRDGGISGGGGEAPVPNAPLWTVAASSDGKRLATGDNKGVLRLWTTEGRPVARTEAGGNGELFPIAFSSDGSRLVTGGGDGSILQWRSDTGAALGAPFGAGWGSGARSTTAVAYSPDGSRIASGDEDGKLRIWDAKSGEPLHTLGDGHAEIFALAYSPDGRHIAAGDGGGELRLWDAANGQAIGVAEKAADTLIAGLAFSPDGKRLVSSDSGNALRVLDATTLRPVMDPLRGHTGFVVRAAYSPDGKQIASTSEDGEVRLWDAATGASLGEPLKGHRGASIGLAYSRDSRHLWTTGLDGTLRQWAARAPAPLGRTLFEAQKRIDSLTFSPDGRHLAITVGSDSVRVWDVSGTPHPEPALDKLTVQGHVWFSADGKRLLTGARDHEIAAWDVATGSRVDAPAIRAASVGEVEAVGSDGTVLLSHASRGGLQVWDLGSGSTVGMPLDVKEPSVRSAVSRDGGRVATLGKGQRFQVWDTRSGKSLLDVPLPATAESVAESVAISPEGSRVAIGEDDGRIFFWRLAGRSWSMLPLNGHSLSVRALAFDKTGLWLASAGADRSLRLWYTVTGVPISEPLRGHEAEITSVAFSPDGRTVASGGENGRVIMWPVLEAWVDALCAKIDDRISPEQWKKWVSPDIPYLDSQCPPARPQRLDTPAPARLPPPDITRLH